MATSKTHGPLLSIFEERFETSKHRHPGMLWSLVIERLREHKKALNSLEKMEKTGGEPDVISFDKRSERYLFVDCAKESPIGRRSVCYDQEALMSRKQNKPKSSATQMAQTMGIEILTEAMYRDLQQIEAFDLKTSSWILTPPEIREKGGALFCDRRYDTVFVYHNGAESYYAARGFRGFLWV